MELFLFSILTKHVYSLCFLKYWKSINKSRCELIMLTNLFAFNFGVTHKFLSIIFVADYCTQALFF